MAEEEDDEAPDMTMFDTSESTVNYSRTKDTKRVTVVVRDPNGISEMRLYLILCREIENLERRLGISEASDEKH